MGITGAVREWAGREPVTTSNVAKLSRLSVTEKPKRKDLANHSGASVAIKTHLADSQEPLKEGTSLRAVCGVTVPDATFLFMWDEQGESLDVSRLKCCGKCKAGSLRARYIYGIRSGEDSKQVGREGAE